MTRTQWTLTAILVLQLVLLALVVPGSGETGASQPRPLLPELEAATPSQIEVRDQEKTLTLRRAEGDWSLEQADGFPADPAKVQKLLDELKGLQVRRPVVSGSRYHAALEVTDEEFERRIRVWDDAQDAPDVDLLVGSSPNYGVYHVRRSGDDRVYEVRGLQPYELRPDANSWMHKQLVDLPVADVTGVKVRNRRGEFELRRVEDGFTLLAGGKEQTDVDPTKVDSFLRAVCGLRASAPAGRAGASGLGLDRPVASVEIHRVTDTDSEVVELALGAEVAGDGAEGRRYVLRQGSSHAAVLDKWDVDRILDKQPGDFRNEG